MGNSILITGVAGSGKSTACKELIRRGHLAYDIEEIEGMFEFVNESTGKPAADYGHEDPQWYERHSWMCDKKRLEKLVLGNRANQTFYCGIAANLDDLLYLFDKMFLLRLGDYQLRKRLSGRRAGDFARTTTMQDWLLGWKQEWENRMMGKGAIAIDAGRTINQVVDEVVKLAGVPRRFYPNSGQP